MGKWVAGSEIRGPWPPSIWPPGQKIEKKQHRGPPPDPVKNSKKNSIVRFGPPPDPVCPISGFEPFSKKSKKSRQGDHSNFEFLGCESMQGSPRGGGRRPPHLGDHLHSLSNTREIRNSSDRPVWIFWIFWKTVQNQKSEKPKKLEGNVRISSETSGKFKNLLGWDSWGKPLVGQTTPFCLGSLAFRV